MRSLNKPFNLLLPFSLLLLLLSFFTWRGTVDLHLHDTYYVIPSALVLRVSAALFLILWALYKATHQWLLSRRLTWIHVVVTLAAVPLFTGLYYLGGHFWRQFHNNGFDLRAFDKYQAVYDAIAWLILAAIAVQGLYLINLAGGLLKRRKR